MASQAAEAHIEGQRRLRELTRQAIAGVWADLPGYDRENLDEWLSRVLPIVAAGQRGSVALTEAFLALELDRAPLGADPEAIVAGVRGDTSPADAYQRPFVTVWTALKAGTEYDQAVAAGLARAAGMGAWDVQDSMRRTLREVGDADDLILGYQRVPDGGACSLCRTVSGQRYHTADLMPIHNHCGCGVDVITGSQRPSFTGRYDRDQVAIREHGELGPVLTDPAHDFTSEADLT